MKNFKKNIGLLTVLFSLLLATNTYASTSSDKDSSSSDSSDSKDNNGGDSVPLDGGLSILLLGAAAFGAKKLHDTRK
jgi:hypothetical protein